MEKVAEITGKRPGHSIAVETKPPLSLKINYIIQPADLVVSTTPLKHESSIEERVKHHYSEIGIDFDKDTDFLDVFKLNEITDILIKAGYRSRLSRKDFREVRNRIWKLEKNMKNLFAKFFFYESRLSHVYSNSSLPVIESLYYEDAASAAQDIALELNDNNKHKSRKFIERALDLTMITNNEHAVTKPVLPSFHHITMAQIFVELGIASLREKLDSDSIYLCLDKTKSNLNFCLDYYHETLYDTMRRAVNQCLKKPSRETVKELKHIRKIAHTPSFYDDKKYSNVFHAKLCPHIENARKLIPLYPSNKHFHRKLKTMTDTYDNVDAALKGEAFYPPLEKQINFCFDRLMILLNRFSYRFHKDESSFRKYLEMFEEPYKRLVDEGARINLRK